MNRGPDATAGPGSRLKLEDYLDAAGNIILPPDVTITSFLDRNIAELEIGRAHV